MADVFFFGGGNVNTTDVVGTRLRDRFLPMAADIATRSDASPPGECERERAAVAGPYGTTTIEQSIGDHTPTWMSPSSNLVLLPSSDALSTTPSL